MLQVIHRSTYHRRFRVPHQMLQPLINCSRWNNTPVRQQTAGGNHRRATAIVGTAGEEEVQDRGFLMRTRRRNIYDRARQKGLSRSLALAGRRRLDAPLWAYRSWCDANSHAAIYVHKANDGNDESSWVVAARALDFAAVAEYCLVMAPTGRWRRTTSLIDAGDAAMDGEEAASTVDVETGSISWLVHGCRLRDCPYISRPHVRRRVDTACRREVSPRCWPSDSNPTQLWWQEPAGGISADCQEQVEKIWRIWDRVDSSLRCALAGRCSLVAD